MVEQARRSVARRRSADPELLDFARAQGKRGLRRQLRALPRRRRRRRRAIPISTTTTGSGAARSTRSSRPSATASAPATTRRRHGRMPAFGRDGMLKRAEIETSPTTCARCRACRSTPGPISPPARRSSPTIVPSVTATTARATGSWRAEPGRSDLALRLRQGGDRRRHLERTRRRDAGLGRAARRDHDQGPDGLRPFVRRRREVRPCRPGLSTSRWLCLGRR